MRAVRIAIVAVSILSLASAGFAQGIQSSVARVAKAQAQAQTAQTRTTGSRRSSVWAGGALVGVGMGMTLWGLLHTSDGTYTTPIDMGKVSSPKLVGAGLAVVGGGGMLMYMGTRGSRAASVSFGPGGLAVSKRVSW